MRDLTKYSSITKSMFTDDTCFAFKYNLDDPEDMTTTIGRIFGLACKYLDDTADMQVYTIPVKAPVKMFIGQNMGL